MAPHLRTLEEAQEFLGGKSAPHESMNDKKIFGHIVALVRGVEPRGEDDVVKLFRVGPGGRMPVVDFIEGAESNSGRPYATSTKASYYASLMTISNRNKAFGRLVAPRVSQAAADILRERHGNHDKTTKVSAGENRASEEELGKLLPWDDLARRVAEGGKSMGGQDRILAGLYVDFATHPEPYQLPPRRLDYTSVRLVVAEPPEASRGESDYLVISPTPGADAELILNKYKTEDVYGTFRRKIHPQLKQRILDDVGPDPSLWRTYLLQKSDGSPLKDGALGERIKAMCVRCTGKPITNRGLRQSFVTYAYTKLSLNQNQKDRLALLLGHSPDVAQRNYLKLNIADSSSPSFPSQSAQSASSQSAQGASSQSAQSASNVIAPRISGGRGYAAGGGARSTCYTCGRTGHWAKDCPAKATATGRRASRAPPGGKFKGE